MINISLYFMDTGFLNEMSVFDLCLNKMSEQRLNAIGQKKLMKDKILGLAAGLLLDYELNKNGLSERNMKYEKEPHGKPSFAGNEPFVYNISHSGTKALLGVVYPDVKSDFKINLGCDIEMIKTANEGVARRFFSSSEYKFWDAADTENMRNKRFYQIWTCKESYVKAIGTGITVNPAGFSVMSEPEDNFRTVTDGVNYYFESFESIEGYAVSVCCNERFDAGIKRVQWHL